MTSLRSELQGTAIQNRYVELYTLLNWAFPSQLGTRSDWKAFVEEPLKRAQKHDATSRQVWGLGTVDIFTNIHPTAQLAIGRERAEALVQNLLPHFFLRRFGMSSFYAHRDAQCITNGHTPCG